MVNEVRPSGKDGKALGQRLAVELTRAVVQAEKRFGRTLDRRELARRLNVSASSLYAYLNGTTLPGSGVLDALLAALGVPGPEAAGSPPCGTRPTPPGDCASPPPAPTPINPPPLSPSPGNYP